MLLIHYKYLNEINNNNNNNNNKSLLINVVVRSSVYSDQFKRNILLEIVACIFQ